MCVHIRIHSLVYTYMHPYIYNVAPCSVSAPPQTNGVDITSRAAYMFNRSSISSSYVSMSWLVPEGPNSMLGPSPRRLLNSGYLVQKSLGPESASFRVPMVNGTLQIHMHVYYIYIYICIHVFLYARYTMRSIPK